MTVPRIPRSLAARLAEAPVEQRSFLWNPAKWESVVLDVPDAREALQSLPERLDRRAVRDVVQANLTRERVLGAFVPVMIWGGPGGYSPFRTRSILTGVRSKANAHLEVDDSIRDRLVAGCERVRNLGAADGFKFMNNEGKIKYLGGAFFSKWLAFTSMTGAVDGPDVAPILDKRVRDWISGETAEDERVSLSTTSSPDYRLYLDILDSWGQPDGRTRSQVELAIFELTRDRPAET